MKTLSLRSIPFLATITAAALVTPCSAAGKEAMMTIAALHQGRQDPE